jgi:replication-associated recombination protein RarA
MEIWEFRSISEMLQQALMKEAGYGKGYEYAHNLETKKSSQEHFPEELKGRKYRK